MAENPFAQFSLEKAIDLRWTLRDIQARRLKMSPVSDEDLRTLTGLGLLGVTRFAELDRSFLHPATATNPPSVFSAYPLLDIEPYRY